MSLTDNSFSRFLLSGFGLGVPAAKAVGIAIFILLLGVIILIWIIKNIYKLVLSIQRAGAPDFKQGPYRVRLEQVGPVPDQLFKELNEISGFRPSLSKKLMDKAPIVIAYGCDQQMADDFVTVLSNAGATLTIER
jgi:ribosomal protein L7/L12